MSQQIGPRHLFRTPRPGEPAEEGGICMFCGIGATTGRWTPCDRGITIASQAQQPADHADGQGQREQHGREDQGGLDAKGDAVEGVNHG